ncbi:MAG: HAMP domain-containing histidine kinase [Elusimicrobia bacterium]|nr:HAMP domain-containing histidine kinase [Elusimicrobiota bacterium]
MLWRSEARKDLPLKLVHDLRNPLSCISGYSRILLRSLEKLSPQHADFVKRILASSQQAMGLLEDLMDQQAIARGSFNLNRTSFILEGLLEEVVREFEVVAQAKGVCLRWVSDGNQTPIWADSKRITQVLSNLLANAIRHTPANGSIMVSSSVAQEQVRVQVQDTGEGVPLEEQEKIFRPFRRAGGNSGGLGLGLSICREIVSKHRGGIGVLSQGADKGACFYFTLPLMQEPSQQEREFPVGVLPQLRWVLLASMLISLLAVGFHRTAKVSFSPEPEPRVPLVLKDAPRSIPPQELPGMRRLQIPSSLPGYSHP